MFRFATLRGVPLLAAWAAGAVAVRGAEARVVPLDVPAAGRAGFTLMAPEATGVAFTNMIPPARHLTNQIYLNGSGVALADVDGDGRLDVFLAGFDGDNALFRNLGGWQFTNLAATAGVAMPGRDCTGAAFADLNGDGHPDLVVNTLGQGTHVFFNDGRGAFRPAPFRLNPGAGGMTVAIADVDGDGWPDLYVVNYRTSALMDIPNARATFRREDGRTVVDTFNGRPATAPDLAGRFTVNARGGLEEHGEPDVLYRSLGGTNFVAVPWTGGAFLDEEGRPLREPPRDWGLAAMFRDVNGDGLPDLYVCNDFHSPDRLWLNQGGGRFRLAPPLALRRTSLSSMAVDFADLDRDGHDDFIVFDMLSRDHAQRMRFVGDSFPYAPRPGAILSRPQIEQNTLFRARGDGTFAEVAQWAGLAASEWTWSGAFVDVDLDGFEDLLVVNGMERAARDPDVNERLRQMRSQRRMSDAEIFAARRAFPRLATANLAFRNRGGLRFEELGEAWGFHLAGVTSALALGDLDGDGDLDVVLNNLNGPAAFYRNDSIAPRVLVQLRGQPPNTAGLGARVRVTGGPVPQSQEILAGGRYLAGDEPVRVFAASTPTNRLTIEVAWRSGRLSTVTGVLPDTAVEILEPTTPPPASGLPPPASPAPPPLFTDATSALDLAAPEEPFDDYARQPLLPYKLSQPGPPAAWVDVDGDGLPDVVLGGAAGGRIQIRRNDGDGRFVPFTNAWTADPLSRDTTAVLGWREGTNAATLLVALSSYEDGATNAVALHLLGATAADMLKDWAASAGPLALADVDGDGDLDLFLGGRVIPGRWPAAADSRLLRREADGWREDPADAALLRGLGLVTAAIFSDLDGDGFPELIVACEWGPLHCFKNDRGRLDRWEMPLRAAAHATAHTPHSTRHLTGLWQSLAAGDFDGDGRLDLVAGNWGRNTPLEIPSPVRPPRVHHGDFDGDGRWDVLEAAWDPARSAYVPRRTLDEVAAAWPGLRGRFPTHAAWADATVETILAGTRADMVEAAVLESVVLLNRGAHFELRALPDEAQFAPVMALAVADFDGDGTEDVIAAQNFFPLRPGSPRLDGGVSTLLLGDGRGGFRALPPAASGVAVWGEARAAAVADFDGDARPDLLVTQNGAAARLFRNALATPGVRVRLVGPPGNPDGLGTTLRVRTRNGRAGPVREIRAAGPGQDATAVVARPAEAMELEVRWPGGRTQRTPLPGAETEVRVLAPSAAERH